MNTQLTTALPTPTPTPWTPNKGDHVQVSIEVEHLGTQWINGQVIDIRADREAAFRVWLPGVDSVAECGWYPLSRLARLPF